MSTTTNNNITEDPVEATTSTTTTTTQVVTSVGGGGTGGSSKESSPSRLGRTSSSSVTNEINIELDHNKFSVDLGGTPKEEKPSLTTPTTIDDIDSVFEEEVPSQSRRNDPDREMPRIKPLPNEKHSKNNIGEENILVLNEDMISAELSQSVFSESIRDFPTESQLKEDKPVSSSTTSSVDESSYERVESPQQLNYTASGDPGLSTSSGVTLLPTEEKPADSKIPVMEDSQVSDCAVSVSKEPIFENQTPEYFVSNVGAVPSKVVPETVSLTQQETARSNVVTEKPLRVKDEKPDAATAEFVESAQEIQTSTSQSVLSPINSAIHPINKEIDENVISGNGEINCEEITNQKMETVHIDEKPRVSEDSKEDIEEPDLKFDERQSSNEDKQKVVGEAEKPLYFKKQYIACGLLAAALGVLSVVILKNRDGGVN